MPINHQRNKTGNYTQIDNGVIEDSRLSLQARMLLVYLLSKPPEWKVCKEQLMKIADQSRKPVRRDAMGSILKELRQYGYLTGKLERKSGRFSGEHLVVHESPLKSPPDTDLPSTVEPLAADPVVVKTDKKVKTDKRGERPRVPSVSSAMWDFATFCQMCELDGEQRIPPNDPAIDFASGINLPADYLTLHWEWFVDRYSFPDEKGELKRCKGAAGWRSFFLRTLRQNWSNYWRKDQSSGQWVLTTAGLQAQQYRDSKRT